MHCPYCKNEDTKVLDSRVADDGGSIRRRRTCSECDRRFTTVEKMQLTVLKRSGATEPFNRDKAIAGVRKACKGRPVSDAQLACLGQDVEDALRLSGAAEFAANFQGFLDDPTHADLHPLRENGTLVSSGGRVLAVVGTGDDLHAARQVAMSGVERIVLQGSLHRTDIALVAARNEGAEGGQNHEH